ncbi:MAG: hypothetical protein GF311_28540 [Candidatus Lokiarchaeota archaeon]|nr:hypothetical protein [Candidatus Lokiarchaeota archaeon]
MAPKVYTITQNIDNIFSTSSGNYLENLQMEFRVPDILKDNAFWYDFIDAIKKEISILVDYASDIYEVWNVEKMEETRMIELNQTWSPAFDLAAKSDIAFLRSETKAIPFKIKYRDTIPFYRSIAYAVNREATLSIYYYNGDYIIRNMVDLLNNIETHTITEPYQQEADSLAFSALEEQLKIDDGWSLDTGYTLDTILSKLPTQHLALEYFINEVIEKDGTNYLMTTEYLNYMWNNVDPLKRVVQVFHIGLQLNAIVKNDNTVNTISPINLQAIATNNYTASTSFGGMYVKFGNGLRNLAPTLTDLSNPIAKINVLNEEVFESVNYRGVVAEYKGQNIIKEISGSLGSTVILDYPQVRYNNVTFSFTYLFIDYEIKDNNEKFYKEFPDADYIEGTINHITGYITFTHLPANPITNIKFDYYTRQNFEITEAGLFDLNDNLIAYSIFPLVEFNSFRYHINFGFILQKIP